MSLKTQLPRWCLVTMGGIALLRAAPVLPTIPATVFPVKSHGAAGDGATDDTKALQATITAAQQAGGGVVELTAPGTYLSGPLTVGSNLDLQIDAGATLKLLPYGTYPLAGTAYANFLSVTGNNVALTGPGTIDGQGAAWWAAFDANPNIPHRPYMAKFTNCNNVLIQNITLIDSPMFHLAFSNANNVTANQVTIMAPTSSVNTDGIDPSGQHVLVENCTISTGDDNVCFKPQGTFCTDCVVTNCTFGTGHGVSVGGQTNLGMDGLTVTNCTFNGTTNGLRLKADPTEGGPVKNCTYSNLTMVGVQYPIVFYSYYDQVGTPGATSGSNQSTIAKAKAWNAAPPDSLALKTIPTWQNITVSNVTAVRGDAAPGYNTVWGLPSAPISNVTFNNVVLSGYPGLEIYNAQNVQVMGASNLGPLLVYNAQVLLVQPAGRSVAVGGTAAVSAVLADTAANAGAVAPAFSWTLNGAAVTDGARSDGSVVSGSKTGTLLIRNFQSGEAGSYAAAVTQNLDGYANGALAPAGVAASVTSSAATMAVAGSSDLGRLMNISALGQGLSAGFAVGGGSGSGGSAGKSLLIRAVGPSLAEFGVSPVAGDPSLQLDAYPSGSVLAQNDNWAGSATVTTVGAQVGAFPLGSAGSLDAALVATEAPGTYTAVTANAGSGGQVLVEVYDATSAFAAGTPRLVNLSARGSVGATALTGGFIVGGSTARTFLVRAPGPALAALGVNGALADPQLSVYDSAGTLIGWNDNWNGDGSAATVAASVGAFPFTDATSKDSALILTLPPGAYSAAVTPTAGSGTALVEIYDVP